MKVEFWGWRQGNNIQGKNQNTQFIYKKLCIYSYIFKLKSPSKYSPFDAIHLSRWFFLILKTVFELFHISKTFPFEDHFFSRKQKSCSGEIWGIKRVRRRGRAVFCQKLLNTQWGVGRCARKSPIMKWARALKESPKPISLKLNTASHNASWSADTDEFLEHTTSGGSLCCNGPTLQKIILIFWGSPLYMMNSFFHLFI